MSDNNRIFLDSLTANSGLTMENIVALISSGYDIVTANTFADMRPVQENLELAESLLVNGYIIIEIWDTPNNMVREKFFWSSCNHQTEAAETLEEAVKDLPNCGEIVAAAYLVEEYGIPKGKWPQGQWVPPAPLSEETAKQLGLDPTTATRTDVLIAAKAANLMNVFDAYNVEYCRGLSIQHHCVGIINSDGTVTFL